MSAPLKSGDCVEVFGLESEGGKDLNGQRGILTKELQGKGRFEVRLAPEKKVSVKTENLKKVELTVAERLRVLGLGGSDEKTRSRSRSREGACASKQQSQSQPETAAGQGEGAAKSATKAEDPDMPELAFKAGHCVEVFGMESEKGKQLNGQTGIVVQYLLKTQRYEVRFIPDYIVSVKESNLRKMEFKFNVPAAEEPTNKATDQKPKSSSSSDSSDSSRSRSRSRSPKPGKEFDTGDAVEIFGLESAEGKPLNGQGGTIVRYVEEKSRFEVRLGPDKVRHFRPINLKKREGNAAGKESEAENKGEKETKPEAPTEKPKEPEGPPKVETPAAQAPAPEPTSLSSLLGLGRAPDVAEEKKPETWTSVWARSGGGAVPSVALSQEEINVFEELQNSAEDAEQEVKDLRKQVEAEMHAAGVFDEEMLETVWKERLDEFKMMKALRPQGSPTVPKSAKRPASESSSSSSSSHSGEKPEESK